MKGTLISVLIVTKNREEALNTLSLPSLLDQEYGDFQVIVFDSSDSDGPERAVKSKVADFSQKGIVLKYLKGKRPGSASQRNDAVKTLFESLGDIIFFMDDDCRISKDGLKGIRECLDQHPGSMGCGLVLYNQGPNGRVDPSNRSFFGLIKKKRTVSLSGSAKGIQAPSGPAEWLSGGSMAFRKEVFASMEFDERLETFGPYAPFEDIEFSHRVYRRYGDLFVAERGYVVHVPAPGDRLKGSSRVAALLYNRYISMQTASGGRGILGPLSYGWSVLRRMKNSILEIGFSESLKGFRMAMDQIKKDRHKMKQKD